MEMEIDADPKVSTSIDKSKTPQRPRGALTDVAAPSPNGPRQLFSPGKTLIGGGGVGTPGKQTGLGGRRLGVDGSTMPFMTPRSHLYSSAAALNPKTPANSKTHQELTAFDDAEEDVRFVEAALRKMPRSELVSQAKQLEDWAYRLGLEETTEMQKGRVMNVLGSAADFVAKTQQEDLQERGPKRKK